MASSESSSLSSLVRTFTSTVTEEDLDRQVAELILKEAKKKAEKYAQQGIHAYISSNLLDSNAPRANKRFLSSIIQSTEDHNRTVLRSQALAAQEIKREREERERRERRLRAQEASDARRSRRSKSSRHHSSKSRRSRRYEDDEDEEDDETCWDRWDGRNADRSRKKRKARNWETWNGESEGEDDPDNHAGSKGKSHARNGEYASRRHRHSTRTRSASPPRDRSKERSSRHKRSRKRERSPTRSLDREEVEDEPEEKTRRDSRRHRRRDRSRRRHHRSRRESRSRCRTPVWQDDDGEAVERAPRRNRSSSRTRHSSPSPARTFARAKRKRSESPRDKKRRHSSSLLRNGLLDRDHRNGDVDVDGESMASSHQKKYRDISSPSNKRHSVSIESPRRLSEPNGANAEDDDSGSSMSLSRSTSASPGPSPPVHVPSKMDKYFDEAYDPRLDVAPLSVPQVPATGLINNAEYEGWDAMLELLRVRKEDKEEKRRLERLGLLPKPKTKGKKDGVVLSSSSLNIAATERWNGESTSIMDISYNKKGTVREWDVGKESMSL